MRSVSPDGWLWLLGVIASGTAAASLWFGAARGPEGGRAGYRWLAAAALLWCIGAAGQALSGQPNGFAAQFTLADVFSLLALAPMVAGIVTLAAVPAASAAGAAEAGERPAAPDVASTGPVSGPMAIVGKAASATPDPDDPAASRMVLGSARRPELATQQFWGYLADCYVMASVLFVIGWLAIFGSQYHRAAEDPRTFLLGLVLPLAAILVVSALLPLVAAAGRRALLPYLALVALTLGDVFGAAVRLAGGHGPGAAELAAKIVGYLLLIATPWVARVRTAHGGRGARDPSQFPAAAMISALAVAGAALLIIVNEVAGGSRVEPVVVFAASGAVAVLAARVFGLIRENRMALSAARVSGGHVRELADRTSDAVLICDLDGTIRYSSPSVSAYGYAAGNIEGRNLADFVHPEDRPAGRSEILRVSGEANTTGGDTARGDTARGDTTGGGSAGGGSAGGGSAGGDPARIDPARIDPAPSDPAPSDPARGDMGADGYGRVNGDTGAHRDGRTLGGGAAAEAGAGIDAGGENTARFGCRVLAADGTWRHIECTVSRYLQPGERGQLLVTVRDVSDQVALRQQVTHLTFHDRLTGLPNRVYFEERVADVLGRCEQHDRGDRPGDPGRSNRPGRSGRSGHASRSGHPGPSSQPGRAHLPADRDEAAAGGAGRRGGRRARAARGAAGGHGQTVPAAAGEADETEPGALAVDDLSGEVTGVRVAAVFLHLDGFTAVNDSAGHAAGDLLITQAARRLRAVVAPQHTLARWGSGEFAVLVEARAGAREVVDLAEQLARCISAEPFGVSGRSIALTASVGVALAGDSTAGDVMRNADVAMSRAKSLGGGLVEIFAAHMHADIVRRLELTSDLQRAVTDELLAVEFQPIVELATSRVTGVEALVRWWRGDEQVPPAEFVGIAEQSGLIVPLGDWVLRTACGQLAQWRRSSWDIGMSVNFSARQIGAAGFVESVLGALADAELSASSLTVEVAEQVLAAHRGETARRLSELRRHGVRIAIDDFGTGYASLGNLRQLPVDIIKVDPSFVSGVGADDTLTLLTHAIVRLGHDLGLTVVAEGIERPRQLELLREMGCALGQGYLVARPMPPSGVESMISPSAGGYGPGVTEQGKAPAPAS